MITALFIIASAAAVVLLAARLREARDEIDQLRQEREVRDRALREQEDAEWSRAVATSVACLLMGLAVASWHAPSRPTGHPPAGRRAGARQGAQAGGPDRGEAG